MFQRTMCVRIWMGILHQTRMTTSISSKALENKTQKAKGMNDNTKKTQKIFQKSRNLKKLRD